MKYILYIDYRAGKGNFEYRPLKAKNMTDAIVEADSIHDAETMYLIKIMQKVGKVEKENDYKVQQYEAKMCKRSKWHKNDSENSEQDQKARRVFHKDWEYIEAC